MDSIESVAVGSTIEISVFHYMSDDREALAMLLTCGHMHAMVDAGC